MTILFDKDDIVPGEDYYEGKFVIMYANCLAEEYRNAKNQLFLAQGGFGCDPTKLGSKVFGRYYDEECYIRRNEIMGVATEEAIQAWEKEYGMSREVFKK